MTDRKITDSFALVLRSFVDRSGVMRYYYAESEPGLTVEEIEKEILNGCINDAELVLRIRPVEGVCEDVTKQVAARVGAALSKRFEDGDDLEDAASTVQFAEHFSEWSRPEPSRSGTRAEYIKQHALTWRDVS